MDAETADSAEQTRWWCEWCGDDFYAPYALVIHCPKCGHGIDDQVDPEDDSIGVYPMGRKKAFAKARRGARKGTTEMATKIKARAGVVAERAAYKTLIPDKLKDGDVFTVVYTGTAYTLTVTGNGEARRFKLSGGAFRGKTFTRLGDASMAIAPYATNGARFWAKGCA